MRLTPEQIRSVTTGILDMRAERGSIRLLRMTNAQRAVYLPGETGWIRSQTMAGVTLDFRTDSEILTLACSEILLNPNYHCTFDVLINGVHYSSFSMAMFS